jgi:hypothetical protein
MVTRYDAIAFSYYGLANRQAIHVWEPVGFVQDTPIGMDTVCGGGWSTDRLKGPNVQMIIGRTALIAMLGAASSAGAQEHALATTEGVTAVAAHVSAVTLAGRKAVEVTGVTPQSQQTDAFAMIDGSDFADGTIEVWLTGHVAPNAPDTSSRGFIGVVFRSADDAKQFENIYLRMTNGRAAQQLRRNHSVQYESVPEYRWNRLRDETPGQYESYVDIQPDVWAKLTIIVRGRHATLYVNDAAQPTLVVNDLKGPRTRGRIGLWVGPESVGYFSHLVIHSTPARSGAVAGGQRGQPR